MQRVFFMVLTLGFAIMFLSVSMNFSTIISSKPEKISVSVIYNDELTLLEVEAYSTIKEVLESTGTSYNYDQSKINLNQIVGHRDVINLPKIEITQCVSINYADLDTLVSLKGIGESVAKRIIEFRELNGSFQVLEDLMMVKGIGNAKFEAIKGQLCL